MKRIAILLALLVLFSCQKKEEGINWEEKKSFAKILDSADDKYVMIDFVKDG